MSPFLTIRDAAERAQVSRNTIKSWMRSGLPFIQISERVVRFRVETFDAWIEDSTIVKTSGTNTSQQEKTSVDNVDVRPYFPTGYEL